MLGVQESHQECIRPFLLWLFNHLVVSDSFRHHGLQNARPPCPSPITRVYSNSSPSSQWCHPTISVISFTSCLQSCPASGSFPMSQLFTSSGQSIGASASASVFPMNIQGWSPLGWTGFVSLQSKGLSRVFSNTIVQRHQFFSTRPFLWSSSHLYTWLLSLPYSRNKHNTVINYIAIKINFKKRSNGGGQCIYDINEGVHAIKHTPG